MANDKYRCFAYRLKNNEGGGRYLPGSPKTNSSAEDSLRFIYKDRLSSVQPVLESRCEDYYQI